jgi:flagellar basal body-associated protein FliL
VDTSKAKDILQSVTRTLLKGLAAALGALFDSVKGVPGQIREGFSEAWVGLRSFDRPTRRMSVIFYLSLIGVGVTFYGFGKYVLAAREREHLAQIETARIAAEEKLKADEARRMREPPPYQSMGTFSLELRESEGVARTSGLRAAEMEIVIACSDLEACEWIKSNIDRSRGELSPLFTPTDREKIMSPGGKRAFREEIRDTLNHLLEERKVKGTIIEVLFPRFIVS